MIKESHVVPEDTCRVRLSDYALTAFPSLASRKGALKAVKRGEILIDGEIGLTGDWLEPGRRLELEDCPRRPPKAYRLSLEIVYEDDYLAVINKPPGIEVSGNKFKTVENALSENLARSTQPDALPWPRPVHRLDYSTSGLLLVAKTTRALIGLGQLLEHRKIHKKYCAVVMGNLSGSGEINTPTNGYTSLSSYTVLETVQSLRNGHVSFCHLFPATGRTHQLRIHMASIGHPIVGDRKYGTTGNTLKGKGLFLAAIELRFPHPITDEELSISIEAPPKFASLMEREQRRWEKFKDRSAAGE